MVDLETVGSLQGEVITNLVLTVDGPHILTNPYRDAGENTDVVVNARLHTDFPGIAVYDLFNCNTENGARRTLSLEEAIADGRIPKRFLVSERAGRAVVTSQLGYNYSTRFGLTEGIETGQAPELDMFNVRRMAPRHVLTARHIERAERTIHGAVHTRVDQSRTDKIFWFLTKAASQYAR